VKALLSCLLGLAMSTCVVLDYIASKKSTHNYDKVLFVKINMDGVRGKFDINAYEIYENFPLLLILLMSSL